MSWSMRQFSPFPFCCLVVLFTLCQYLWARSFASWFLKDLRVAARTFALSSPKTSQKLEKNNCRLSLLSTVRSSYESSVPQMVRKCSRKCDSIIQNFTFETACSGHQTKIASKQSHKIEKLNRHTVYGIFRVSSHFTFRSCIRNHLYANAIAEISYCISCFLILSAFFLCFPRFLCRSQCFKFKSIFVEWCKICYWNV